MVKLATERKHLTDIIKMVAYQAESDLLALLRPHYARVDQEGRTLLHELFATAGDIRVGDGKLHITWLRSARRIERTPPTPSARCSTKRRPSSPALACGFGSQCARDHTSGLLSLGRRSSAAPPRLFPRFPNRLRNRTFCVTLCQEF
jgi:hypothetical protein